MRQTSNSFSVRGSMPLAASNDHDGRIDGGQRAIGIVGKVFVTGRIENVEDIAVIFEGHHRGDDRDAAFALDLHPVGSRLDPVLLRLDFAGKLDRAAEQQQFFGQRRLTRIRVGNNSKGATAGNRLGDTFGHDVNPVSCRVCSDSVDNLQFALAVPKPELLGRSMSIPSSTRPALKLVRLQNGEGIDLPAYETAGAAGMDLRAAVEADRPLFLGPGKRALVPTGFIFEVPAGYEAQIRPRSGLAFKNGITCLNTPGTIDSDYRGEVKVLLINLGDEDFLIERGMRIAQMVIAPVTQVAVLETTDASDTARGAGGFGSTGV